MSIHFIYGTATNTGKGFFTHQDRLNFFLRGYPAEVWCVGNNVEGARWLADKNGVEKTKSEAQTLVTAEVEARQADYDSLSDAEKSHTNRPDDITLP